MSANEVRDQSIEDLEVSVRTAGLFQSLGVATVGELLDLPNITIPADWPRQIASLVAREILEVFESLGVEYDGEIVAPPPVEPKHAATGDVTARWTTIAEWLRAEHPRALAQFNPPATDEAIAAAEKAIGHRLPDDYKQFLRIHDGQVGLAPMVGFGSLLPIKEVADAKSNIIGEETPVDAGGVGPGIRAVDYSHGWVPISRSPRGRDYLCIDLDPAPGGTRGQIVEYVVDSDVRPLVAKSFADLLSKYFEQVQTGEIDLTEVDEDE